MLNMPIVGGSGDHVFVVDIWRMEIPYAQHVQIDVASYRTGAIDPFQFMIAARVFQNGVLDRDLLPKNGYLVLSIENKLSICRPKS